MSKTKERAFPGSYTGNNGMPVWSDGMTLRDYFAAKAMQGFCANPEANRSWDVEEVSKWVYRQADAMLAAREQEPR